MGVVRGTDYAIGIQALETIGAIEIEEGLPHPMIDGEWGKKIPSASAAYLIMGFGEEDIEEVLALTKKAGLRYLYHSGPFENWGHFKLNEKQFPSGVKGLRHCVEKAKSKSWTIFSRKIWSDMPIKTFSMYSRLPLSEEIKIQPWKHRIR